MIVVRSHTREDYKPVWHAMQHFTATRTSKTPDEIWFTEHSPVFTLGLKASSKHLVKPGTIPVVRVDRGGQVTYHGPGQLLVYPLIDLKRANLTVRQLIMALEQSVINFLETFGVEGNTTGTVPGVYVDNQKIASIGLRIKHGASFHGMALNIDVELEPFTRINPCGFKNLVVTHLHSIGIHKKRKEVQASIQKHLLRHLNMLDKPLIICD
ncbi:MAG: octanoyltransferase [Woeseia sp.]|nr:octanoyltransferase [Woeseia sp.]|tara:strand:+ start:687 stop:1319 length:633 start_codon:yes stop_codon:yes gene_type:complete